MLLSCPRYAQPIAIEDVLDYLLAVIEFEHPADAIYEIGGRDRVTYADVMREYARQRGLRRRVISTPLITSGISRLLLGLLTPVYGRIAASMVESLRNETIVTSSAADRAFAVRPRGLPLAIERALVNEDHEFAETRWSDALPTQHVLRWGGLKFGRRLVSSRVAHVASKPEKAFAPIQRTGGTAGWYADDWFWRLRGLLDTLRGGVGLRRGRRDPRVLRVGDTVDFWRVERFEPQRLVLLTAEMKIPGRLWLQFEVDPDNHDSLIRQTTIFEPAGYLGLAYWYLLYPVLHRVFGRMLRGIGRAAQSDNAPTISKRPLMRSLRPRARRRWDLERWETGRCAEVHVLPKREIEQLPESGAAQSVQEAEVVLPSTELERLWRPEHLERLARSYWRFLVRVFLGLIRVVHIPDSPSIVFLSRHFPLLHFHAPVYESGARQGRATWRIERGLLVARRGRGRGFLRISVERLDRKIEDAAPAPGPRAAVLVRVEVRNFYPWLRGRGRLARVGTWVYRQTQLRIHVLVSNAFLRSLVRVEFPRSPIAALTDDGTAEVGRR